MYLYDDFTRILCIVYAYFICNTINYTEIYEIKNDIRILNYVKTYRQMGCSSRAGKHCL